MVFNAFNNLHDNRQSDSIQYFSFYDISGNLIQGDVSVTFTDDGQFDTLTAVYDGTETVYYSGEYTYTTECLYVLGIGFLIPGDIVKLKISDMKEYELRYGWHTNISGQTLYSWYLVPRPIEDMFLDQRKGILNMVDLAEMNVNHRGILTLEKSYLSTIEVVQFTRDRKSFGENGLPQEVIIKDVVK